MVKTTLSVKDYSVSIEAFDVRTDIVFSKVVDELTFMQAGDYAEKSVEYFEVMLRPQYAKKSGWHVVQIEVMDATGTIEVIRISR